VLWKTSEKCPKFPEVRHQTANIKYYSNAIGGKFWRIIVPTYGCVMHRHCSRSCLKWPVHNAFWITRNTTYVTHVARMFDSIASERTKRRGKKNSITIECLSPTSVITIMMRNRTRCACLRKRAFAPAVTTTSTRGHSCDWESATQSILGAIPIDASGVLNGIMH